MFEFHCANIETRRLFSHSTAEYFFFNEVNTNYHSKCLEGILKLSPLKFSLTVTFPQQQHRQLTISL